MTAVVTSVAAAPVPASAAGAAPATVAVAGVTVVVGGVTVVVGGVTIVGVTVVVGGVTAVVGVTVAAGVAVGSEVGSGAGAGGWATLVMAVWTTFFGSVTVTEMTPPVGSAPAGGVSVTSKVLAPRPVHSAVTSTYWQVQLPALLPWPCCDPGVTTMVPWLSWKNAVERAFAGT